mgnify:CR=1 FL=1
MAGRKDTPNKPANDEATSFANKEASSMLTQTQTSLQAGRGSDNGISYELQAPLPAIPGRYAILDVEGTCLHSGVSRDLSKLPPQLSLGLWRRLIEERGAVAILIWP